MSPFAAAATSIDVIISFVGGCDGDGDVSVPFQFHVFIFPAGRFTCGGRRRIIRRKVIDCDLMMENAAESDTHFQRPKCEEPWNMKTL